MRPARGETDPPPILRSLQGEHFDRQELVAVFEHEFAAGPSPELLVAAAALVLCELIDDQTCTRFFDAVDAVAASSALRPRITDPTQQIVVDGGIFVARYHADPSDAALPALAEALVRSSADAHIDASPRTCALWPELDGDKAKVAFNVTLHRLRKR